MQTISPSDQQAKIAAAFSLLTEETTTFEKFDRIVTLVKGVNPKADRYLAECQKSIAKLKLITDGSVIELSGQALPENTNVQKKRKKLLLIFISSYKKLKSEVTRINDLYSRGKGDDGKYSASEHLSVLGKIATTAKGPFGLISLAALAVAGVLFFVNSSAVIINIQNNGCPTIKPPLNLPKLVPGISIPENITSQGQSQAKVFPFKFLVKLDSGQVKLQVLGLNYSFNIVQQMTGITFNSKPITSENMTIDLSSAKEHNLVITCL